MKIMFWSGFAGQCGTSCNLLAVAHAIAKKYPISIVQSGFRSLDLLTKIAGNQKVDFSEGGLDALVRIIKSEHISNEIIDSCMVSPYNRNISVLKASTHNNQEMFDTSVSAVMKYIINSINLYYNLVFVDVGSGTWDATMNILDEADIIVVNINQNLQVIESTLKQPWLQKKKVFCLIGMYETNSQYNMTYLKKRIKLSEKRIGVIPYALTFRDACSNGTANQLFMKWDKQSRGEEGYYFTTQVEESAKKILDFISLEGR